MPATADHRTAAAAVAAVAFLTAIVAVALLPFTRTDEAWTEWFFLTDVTVAVVYGLLAYLLLSRSAGRGGPAGGSAAPGAAAVGALSGLAAIGCGLAAIGHRLPEQLPDLVGTAWVPGTLALITVMPWLVRDDPLPFSARLWVAAGATVTVAISSVRAARPLGGEFRAVVENTLPAQMAVVVVLGLAATAGAAVRWRRLPGDRRRGLGWLTAGSALMALSFVPIALPLEVSRPIVYASVTPVLQLAAQAFFPAAALAVVLRQRLWGIDVAVGRTLLWSLLTAGAVTAYVLIAQAVVLLAPLPDGTAGAVAAGVLAVAVFPARTWLQQRIDRLVHGPAARPGLAAERLAHRMTTDATGPDAVRPVEGALASMRESLRLHSIRLEIGADGEEEVMAEVGRPGGPPLTLPLRFAGRVAGRLVVTGAPGERLGARTRKDLGVLAGPVAAVAQLAVRTGELAAARARTTAARVEERRLLRRELHDRLGPTLIGIGLAVRGARGLVAAGRTAEAAGVLDALREELDRSAEDVRTLARTLLPPSLEHHGLAAALAELAERLSGPDLTVRAEVTGPAGELAPEMAAALYGIAAEALVNARRHAGAAHAAVHLTCRSPGPEVLLEISDDGSGLPGDAEPGVGLRSMRERAEELGGVLSVVQAVPSGTVVRLAFRP
ncbi:histidine kinase [Actinoplanes sp. NPDC023714]|uniref:sensor histidine kinase n=1 Tax=Actinoplanes sp. NPDC023714 TaxID=3154322 RepID=UPI0033E32CE2